MNINDEIAFKKWQRKRLTTVVVFCLYYGVIGVGFTMFTNSAWEYVSTMIKPLNPIMIYSLISYARYITGALFIIPSTFLHDKYRRTKLFMTITNFLSIIGSLLYVISSSVYPPLIGMFLMGFSYVMLPISVGEISRSYIPTKITRIIASMTFTYFVGYIPGALILYFAENLYFHIGPFVIDKRNIAGIIYALLFILLQILTLFCVHDISLEYDLKDKLTGKKRKVNKNEKEEAIYEDEDECFVAENKDIEDKKNQLTSHENIELSSSFSEKFKRIFTSADIILLYSLVF